MNKAAIMGSKRCGCGKTISANALHCKNCAQLSGPLKIGGCLEILNVQGGDVKISFDKGDVAESIRARRIVTDMLRRGYALVVEIERGGERAYERVQAFDESKGEYIIADLDSRPALPEIEQEQDETEDPKPRRGRPPGKRVPMESAKATAIGRSAGG